jgi:hypothetical protein
MPSRKEFATGLATLDLSHEDRAIALLWYYRESQEFDERTAADLAADLHEEGFPRPHVTKLHRALTQSKFTIRGRRPKSFQLDLRHVADLEAKYRPFLNNQAAQVEISGAVLPNEAVAGTRVYLEKLTRQINGSYDYGFYDSCAVLCRRLMESLIIEVYIHKSLQDQIKRNNVFMMLDGLIAHIRTNPQIHLGRNSPGTMDDLKDLGDTAAHDRTYITKKQDIDDIKMPFRRMIEELLTMAGIRT